MSERSSLAGVCTNEEEAVVLKCASPPSSTPRGSRAPASDGSEFVVGLVGYVSSFAVAAGLVILGAYVQMQMRPQGTAFNPQETCTSPPLGCWDGLSKYENNLCTTFDGPPFDRLVTLPNGHAVRKGDRSCYKSIFFSHDWNAAAIVACFCAYTLLVGRTVERFVFAAAAGSLRPWPAAASVGGLLQLFYSSWMLFHYLNDRFFAFLPSQLFFSATEFLSYTSIAYHVDGRTPPAFRLVVAQGGIAAAHFLQLAWDESLIVFGGNLARNSYLAAGDIVTFVAAYHVLVHIEGVPPMRAARYFGATALVLLTVFPLLFSHESSLSIWRLWF